MQQINFLLKTLLSTLIGILINSFILHLLYNLVLAPSWNWPNQSFKVAICVWIACRLLLQMPAPSEKVVQNGK